MNKEMNDEIYLATLLYKNIVDDKDKELVYKVLGPMMGTLQGEIYINTNDRMYHPIEKVNLKDDIRYTYYDLISLSEAMKKYKTEDLNKLVEMYNNDYKDSYYYVHSKKEDDFLMIKFSKEQILDKYTSEVAPKII